MGTGGGQSVVRALRVSARVIEHARVVAWSVTGKELTARVDACF